MVKDQTLADLKRLDFGTWKAPEWAGETIPTLEEVLATLPVGKRLYIEIKCGTEVMPFLETAVQGQKDGSDQVVVIGFDLTVMRIAKQRMPEIKMLGLAQTKPDPGRLNPPVELLIRLAAEAGLDGLSLEAGPSVDRECVKKMGAAGMDLCVWTVNDQALAHRMQQAGVERITTDRPQWLRRILN